MSHASTLISEDILAYLEAHEHKSLLRFITCGSVDDGKSTLIGRLLYESQLLFEDQLAALERDSQRDGTQGDGLDFALLLDGLAAEREQGITIDVAYRYFSTDKRKYIVADTPGHEQYTRNMVTGASTADCAVILVDARKGVLTQTRRHSYLVSLLGIRHVAVAVNKMDLVDYSEERFREIERDYRVLASQLAFDEITCIPLSALRGDNMTERSEAMPWYRGPTLMEYLETVEVDQERLQRAPFRLPVQWVNRPDLDFRGFAGTIAGGAVASGDRVVVLPSGRESTVERIVTFDGDLERAIAGQAVTFTLADEIDVSRGDLLAAAAAPPPVGDQFEATVVWMADEPLLRGRTYVMRVGTKTVTATIAPLKYKLNVDSLEHVAANQLALNEIGVVELELSQPIAFDPYAANRETGGFILIDRITNNTVGAGMLHFALRRSANVQWQPVEVDRAARAALKGQEPFVVWLTGLPGAGKSAIADVVEQRLLALGRHTYLLDGDNVRQGLNKDLGFRPSDRAENIRRAGEVAKLMVDAGLIVLAAFISPFRADRETARSLFADGEFLEVHVDAPVELAARRDRKGLYAKAERGELANLTGVDAPYEPPEDPDLRLDMAALTLEEAAERVLAVLRDRQLVP
ncbi:MAG: sulfate adenylyltransferase subunit CysN [Actinobacteria bacterium]|nr:MAG: sulfate adenylyltransferase subunit CysN [Actinomycetota bacterium]